MKSLLFAFAAIFLLTDCSRILYVPNSLNMPLLEKKNDFNANMATRLTGPFTAEIQAGYAPLDHFLVTLNGMTVSGNNFSAKTKNDFIEAGVGLFHAFEIDDNPKVSLRMELTGGYGLGKGSSVRGDIRSVGGFQRKYLQEAIGIRSKIVDFSFGMRIAEVNFSRYSDYDNNQLIDRGYYDFSTIEPVFRLGLGGNDLKVFGELGFTVPSKDSTAFMEAVGDPALWFLVYGGFSVGRFDRKPKPRPAFSLESTDTSSQERQPVTLQIYHNKCVVCLRQKGADKQDVFDLRFNGAPFKEGVQLDKLYACYDFWPVPGEYNLLNIKRSSDATATIKPVEVLVRDGKHEHRFFLNIGPGETEEIRLKFIED